MHNVKASQMSLFVLDDTNSTKISPLSNHSQNSRIELDVLLNLSGHQIELDRVSSLDVGIGIANGSSVVSDGIRNALLSDCHFFDFQKLELALFGCDSVNCESSLGVIQQSVRLLCFFDRHHIHESSRIIGVSADNTIDLDESLSTDGNDFSSGEGILESISEENHQRKALPQLVRTR